MTAPGSQRGEIIMKKRIASAVLASAMAFCLAGCAGTAPAADKVQEAVNDVVESTVEEVKDQVEDVAETVSDVADEVAEEVADTTDDGVMTYQEYAEAALESEVTIVTYVQAHQSWWDGKLTVYTQDQDGGYFLYELPVTEEDAEKFVPGTKIKVTGYKSEWSGEIEITDATYEFVDDGDTFIAEPKDITDKLGTDDLINYMNQKVAFNGFTVVARPSGNAFDYKYDNSGSHDDNSDLYFDVQDSMGNVYTFTVESYLCGNDSDVYAAVEGLNVGDVIDCEGFLYWYEGANPHITGIGVKTN